MDSSQRKVFSSFEKEVLLEVCSKYIGIIENKKTDAISARQKQQTWKDIEKDYNSIHGVLFRTALQLKNCYKNMKKRAVKRRMHNNVGQRLMSMGVLRKSLNNSFDSDAQSCSFKIAKISSQLDENIEFSIIKTENDAGTNNENPILEEQSVESQTDGIINNTDSPLHSKFSNLIDIENEIVDTQTTTLRCNQRLQTGENAASAILEQSKAKKAEIEQKRKIELEEHKMKMLLMRTQLKIHKKVLEILNNNPSSLTIKL